jgi:chromosome segregation ATPase
MGFGLTTEDTESTEMALTEITAAFGAIKCAVDLLKSVNEAKTEVEKNNITLALQGQLLELQSRLSSIQSNYDQLYSQKQEIEAELKKLIERRDNYVLIGIGNGSYAYDYVGKTGGEFGAHHYLCQLCFDKGIKSVLHGFTANGRQYYECKESESHRIRI